MKKFLLTLFISGFVHVFLFSQTIHLISVIDRYSNIAESCDVDAKNIEALFTNISNDIGMALKIYNLEFDQAKTIEFINNFTCTNDDVVFFYYSGHGFRYKNQEEVWPFLNVCQSTNATPDECGVDLNWVHKKLIEKKPRLSIAIGDCCNNKIDWNEPRTVLSRSATFRNSNTADGYEKLFLKSSGHIVASGSIPGQYSLGTQTGGLFTNGLIETIKKARTIEDITWKNVFEKAQSYTLNSSNDDQKPHYLLQMPSGNLYSEGEYPNLEEVEIIPEQEEEWIEPDEWTDDGEWQDEYEAEESAETILYDLGIIFLFGVSADDGIISDNEYYYLYEYFNYLLTQCGYDNGATELFFTYLSQEISLLSEEELYLWLNDAILFIFEIYSDTDFIAFFTDLANMTDYSTSQGYTNFINYVDQVLGSY